jgi:CBS domain-containing protein
MPEFSKLTVSDVMTKSVLTLTKDVPVSFAYNLMTKNRIGGIPVVDGGRLVGIVTLTDIKKVNRKQMIATKLEAVMTKKLVVANPEEKLSAVLSRMSSHKIGRVPVVSRTGHRLLGIVTHKDAAYAMTSIKKPPKAGVDKLSECRSCGAPFKEYGRVEKCAYCGTVNVKW